MIDIIVFSKDRPLQLDTLLQSLDKNMANVGNVWVLYKASNEFFQDGYNKCIGYQRKSRVFWLKETNFYNNVHHLLKHISTYFAFATDDDIMYRPCNIIDSQLTDLFDIYNCCCVSLRLGSNTRLQYNKHQEKSILPFKIHKIDQFNIWNHNSIPCGNFGYPLSVDCHIFHKETIIELLNLIEFNQPNEMEGRLCQFKNRIKPNMACLDLSCVVNTPINRCQEVCTNLHSQQYGRTLEELNTLFLEGKRVILDKLNFNVINGCHQEIPLIIQ